jgi:hypothetical protein
MISHELARERMQTLLQEAEQNRRVQAARTASRDLPRRDGDRSRVSLRRLFRLAGAS